MRASLRLLRPASATATGGAASPSLSPLTALRRSCSSGGADPPPPPPPTPRWQDRLCNSRHLHGGAAPSSLYSPPAAAGGADLPPSSSPPPPPPPPRRAWGKVNPQEGLCNTGHLSGAASSSLTSPPASTCGADPTPSPSPPQYLTPEEIAQVSCLLPNLCNSGHLREAVALLDASLLAGAPLDALPIAAVLRRLCGGSDDELLRHDMTHSMALLTALLHNPRRPLAAAAAIAAMLVETYLELRRPREALKVFDWMRRPKSPCPPEPGLWRALVQGLCRYGRLPEALRVLKEMMVAAPGAVAGGGGVAAEDGVRQWVYWSLLNEARVREGQELDEALGGVCEGADEEACERVVHVLDRIIRNWRD